MVEKHPKIFELLWDQSCTIGKRPPFSFEMPVSSSRITQEYFDELVLENVEVFDLTHDEGLQETLQQLSLGGIPVDHLLITTNAVDREERQDFDTSLRSLRNLIQESPDSSEEEEPVETHLVKLLSYLQKDYSTYSIVWAVDGFAIYLTLLERRKAVPIVLNTLSQLLTHPQCTAETIQAFQKNFTLTVMQVWMQLYAYVECSTRQQQQDLLIIAYWSCKRCESNKELWMEQRIDANEQMSLFTVLQQRFAQPDDDSLLVWQCRFLTVICRNDFDEVDAPLTASATARVQQCTANASGRALIETLNRHLQCHTNHNQEDEAILVALLQLCRALAIHNDVVLTMKEQGLVETVLELLKSSSSSSSSSSSRQVVALTSAAWGFCRNLCANDDLQAYLGSHIVPTLAASLAKAVEETPQLTLLEQGCGLVGALALRNASNARHLVQLHAPSSVVAAMQLHRQAASLQRCGAYAIRHLVSRITDDAVKIELQTLCKPVLLEAAATHAECQEAVYAALRDLGCPVQMNTLVLDPHGRTKLQGTAMFEPGSNAGFRAEYDH